MTEKQMKAFLKKEGWKRCGLESCSGWRDPSNQKCWTTASAFRLASRRKRERETRRLKAAGWWPCYRCGLWKARWTNDRAVALGNCFPKAEALATLEAP